MEEGDAGEGKEGNDQGQTRPHNVKKEEEHPRFFITIESQQSGAMARGLVGDITPLLRRTSATQQRRRGQIFLSHILFYSFSSLPALRGDAALYGVLGDLPCAT